MEKLKLHILNEIKENRLDVKTGSELLAELSDGAENREPVAVVGMALRCPQADNLRQFRCNLLNKTDSVREFPETRRKEIAHWLPDEFCETDDPYQIQGYLDDISLFDESFFGLSAAEAKKMHPIQRLFMMCAFEALEDAGYVPDEGMKTAVYVGNAQLGEPGYNDFMQEMDGTGFIGAAASMIPARIAYFLGLNGPGMVIDSACTSGLLGVHMACEALRKKEIDCAIVCGAALNLMPLVTERITFMESPEYVISPFDERADGTVWGEGAGVVVLKRAGTAAASKDRVYALIRGNGANSNGASASLTALDVNAQSDLMDSTWKRFSIQPENFRYFEAHGTGTAIGDAIEVKSISQSLANYTDRKQFCGLGTVKCNIGHTTGASGVISMIKAAQALNTGEVPPVGRFSSPGIHMDLVNTPLFIADEKLVLDPKDREALIGVNSFGISGTNVHVVLGRPEPCEGPVRVREGSYPLLLSARNVHSLMELLLRYAHRMQKGDADLEDICFTAYKGRMHHNLRAGVYGSDKEQMVLRLKGLREAVLSGKELPEGCFYSERTEKNTGFSEPWARVCAEYAAGSLPDAGSLFPGGVKVSLPGYPFELNRRWADSPEKIPHHPVTGRVIYSGNEEDMYETVLDPRSWRFAGGSISALSLLEMICQTAEIYYPKEAVLIKNIRVEHTVSKEKTGRINTVAVKREDGIAMELSAVSLKDGRTVKLAEAEAVPALSAREKVQIPEQEKQCFTREAGRRWHYHLTEEGRECKIELKLDQRYSGDMELHHFHPDMLETLSDVLGMKENTGWCLKECETIILYGNLPEHVHAEVAQEAHTEGHTTWNIRICSEEEVIADIKGFVLGKVPGDDSDENDVWTEADDRGLTGRPDHSYTPCERAVGQVFRETLGLEKVHIDHSFFELGGDSLMAISLVNQLEKRFGYKADFLKAAEAPSIRSLAAAVTQNDREENVLEKAPEMEYYPLSFSQKQIYSACMLNPEILTYNFIIVLELNGIADRERIEKAFHQTVQDNPSLRTKYTVVDAQPVQSVCPGGCEFNCIEMEERVDRDSLEAMIHSFHRPFDLSEGRLLRITLVKDGEEHGYILAGTHHIAADGYSMALLFERFTAYYMGGEVTRPELEYTDYAYNLADLPESVIAPCRRYWQSQFADEIQALNLPGDYEAASNTGKGAVTMVTLDEAVSSEIKKHAARAGVTPGSFLLTAFFLALRKFSGQNDIVIGVPFAGRKRHEISGVIGMFVETLPIRLRTEGGMELEQLVRNVHKCCMDGITYSGADSDRLAREGDGVTCLAREPLYRVMYTFQNLKGDIEITDVISPKLQMDLGDLHAESTEFLRNTAHCDLMMETIERDGKYLCCFEYSTDLFRENTVQRFAEYVRNIIHRMAGPEKLSVSEASAVSETEKKRLLDTFCGNRVSLTWEDGVIPSFLRAVKKYPERTALIYGNRHISYAELNAMSDRIACQFADYGIQEGNAVVLRIKRSPELIAAVTALWKTGAVYVPAGVDYPLERIRNIFEMSEASCIAVCSDSPEEELAEVTGDRLIYLDLSYPARTVTVAEYSKERPAYIIFTSGSTGRPKGAVVAHGGMTNHISAKINDLGLSHRDVMAVTASPCFDISIWQFFCPLMVGGKAVIFDEEHIVDADMFVRKVTEQKVSILEVVPAYLLAVLDSMNGRPADFHKLRYLLVTGDVVSVGLVNRWLALFPDIPVVNAYGPTEASDDITHYMIKDKLERNSVPVGKTIQNLAIYILDEDDQLCPVGVHGEIVVSGPGVGHGYINDPEQTRKAFGRNPFRPEYGRMYRTGDLGHFMEDGTLCIHGRKDHQIKLRGFRIELNEIAMVAESCDGVREAAATVCGSGDSGYICCYYTSETGEMDYKIMKWLEDRLPSCMLPSVLMRLEEMPHNNNGKIDRKALPVPQQAPAASEIRRAESPAELAVAASMSRLLGLNEINMNDTFFGLGGDSIRAIQLASTLRQFGYSTDVQSIYAAGTIGEIARTARPVSRVDQSDRTGEFALTPMQKKYISAFDLKHSGWNQNLTLIFTYKLDEEILKQAVGFVAESYSSLQLVFTGELQHYEEGSEVHWICGRSEMEAWEAAEWLNRQVSVQSGINFGGTLSYDGTHDRLILAASHLVVDSVSFRQLAGDIYRAYTSFAGGRKPEAIVETGSFKTYSQVMERLFAEGSHQDHYRYYRKYLAGCQSVFGGRERGTYAQAVTERLTADRELTDAVLGGACRAYGTSVEHLLLCALVMGVYKIYGIHNICVFCEHDMRLSGLPSLDLSQSVGWLAAEYPLVFHTEGCDMEKVIIQVKDQSLLVPWNGACYMYARDRLAAEGLSAPEDILFNYMGSFDGEEEKGAFDTDEEMSGLWNDTNEKMPFVLEVNAGMKSGHLILDITCDSKAAGAEAAGKLAGILKESLKEITDHCVEKKTVTETPGDYNNRYLSMDDLKYLENAVSRITD